MIKNFLNDFMKKFFLILLFSVILSLNLNIFRSTILADIKTIILEIDSEYMIVNGVSVKIDAQNSKPFIHNGRTLVPMAGIFDALSATYKWDGETRSVTAQKEKTAIYLEIDNPTAYKNGEPVLLEIAPIIKNDKTMIPLRFVSESLGAEVLWDNDARTITITSEEISSEITSAESSDKAQETVTETSPKEIVKEAVNKETSKETINNDIFISVSDKKAILGDSKKNIVDIFGIPNRVDKDFLGLEWYVYNSDYSNFIMIGFENNIVNSIYSNAKNSSTKYVKIGSTNPRKSEYTDYYTDKHDKNRVFAFLITSGSSDSGKHDDKFLKILEKQIFDITNAYRVFHNLSACINADAVAQLTARKHSEDMAHNGYFDHINLRGENPLERYQNNNGRTGQIGENLHAGYRHSFDIVGDWVGSKTHRDNMLIHDHKYLGVGCAYNPDSDYIFYSTQLFTQ